MIGTRVGNHLSLHGLDVPCDVRQPKALSVLPSEWSPTMEALCTPLCKRLGQLNMARFPKASPLLLASPPSVGRMYKRHGDRIGHRERVNEYFLPCHARLHAHSPHALGEYTSHDMYLPSASSRSIRSSFRRAAVLQSLKGRHGIGLRHGTFRRSTILSTEQLGIAHICPSPGQAAL
jgi:hypothetical protein